MMILNASTLIKLFGSVPEGAKCIGTIWERDEYAFAAGDEPDPDCPDNALFEIDATVLDLEVLSRDAAVIKAIVPDAVDEYANRIIAGLSRDIATVDPVKKLVEAVKRHAVKHYESGWDVVVECMEDADIARHLEPGMTEEQAIRRVAEREYLQAYNDRRNDALAAGGLETTTFETGLES